MEQSIVHSLHPKPHQHICHQAQIITIWSGLLSIIYVESTLLVQQRLWNNEQYISRYPRPSFCGFWNESWCHYTCHPRAAAHPAWQPPTACALVPWSNQGLLITNCLRISNRSSLGCKPRAIWEYVTVVLVLSSPPVPLYRFFLSLAVSRSHSGALSGCRHVPRMATLTMLIQSAHIQMLIELWFGAAVFFQELTQ